MTVRIRYDDGSAGEVGQIIPAAFIDVEEETGRAITSDEVGRFRTFTRLVHRTLQLRAGEERDFRTWVETVDDIADVADEVAVHADPEDPHGGEPIPSQDDSPA